MEKQCQRHPNMTSLESLLERLCIELQKPRTRNSSESNI